MNEDIHRQKERTHNVGNKYTSASTSSASGEAYTALQGEESWSNLLTLMDIIPDALVLVDSDGCIRRVNNQTEEVFGYTGAELEGLSLEVLIPERYWGAHVLDRKKYNTLPITRPMGVGLDLYGLRKDGSEFPVDISLSPLLFDGTLHVLAAVRDITMRKYLEAHEHEARATAEARLALLQLVLDELPTCVLSLIHI